MLVVERREKIRTELKEKKKVIVSELAGKYNVTEETIRRDLDKLVREGIALKSYGGAVLKEREQLEVPFTIRKKENRTEKQLIADQLETVIRNGMSLMMDSSSSCGFAARRLQEKRELTIITNSIEIVMEGMKHKNWHLISTGGEIREGSYAMAGELVNAMLRNYFVDCAVISCQALDMDCGIMDADEGHAQNKQTMLERAGWRILLADHTKFGQKSFRKVADFRDIDLIITDLRPQEEWIRFFEQCEVECMYSEGETGVEPV